VSPTSTDPIRPFLEERHLELAKELLRFARSEIAPLPAAESDAAARSQARQLLGLLGEAGWFRYAIPDEGGAPDLRACCLAREALGATSPLADAVFALQALGGHPILRAGTPEIRERWLHEIATGSFDRPLPTDGTPLVLDVTLAGDRAEIALPDGTPATVRDARIPALPAPVACWEFYRHAPGGAAVRL